MQGYASDLQVLFGILFTNIKLRKITVHDIASQSDTSRLAEQGITGHYQAQPGRTHPNKARPFLAQNNVGEKYKVTDTQ